MMCSGEQPLKMVLEERMVPTHVRVMLARVLEKGAGQVGQL